MQKPTTYHLFFLFKKKKREKEKEDKDVRQSWLPCRVTSDTRLCISGRHLNKKKKKKERKVPGERGRIKCFLFFQKKSKNQLA